MAMPEGFLKSRFPVCGFQTLTILTANDKDFSLALEMTVREGSQSPATPIAQGQPFFKKCLTKVPWMDILICVTYVRPGGVVV